MSNIDIVDEYGTNKIFTGAFLRVLFISLLAEISGLIGITVNGIIISRSLGGTSMSAAGLFEPLSTFINLLSAIISTGHSIACGRKIGAMKSKEANQIFSSACFLVLLISFFFATLCFWLVPFLAQLLGGNADSKIYMPLVSYIKGNAIGIPGIMIVAFLMPVMQLEGDKRRAIIAAVVLCVSNIIGDLVNVLVVHGGMFGMGITTSISYYISSIILLFHFFGKSSIKNTLSFRITDVKKNLFMDVIKSGISQIFQRMSTIFRSKSFNSLAMFYGGTSGFPAFATVNNFSAALTALPKAFGATSLLMQGILMGEEDPKTVKNVLNLSLTRAIMYNTVFACLIFFVAPYLVLLYTPETSSYYMASVSGIRWYSACLIPYAINMVYTNYLQCNHKLKMASILLFTDGFLSPYIFALIMTKYIALNGIMAAFFVGKLFVSLATIIWISIKNKHLAFSVSDYLLLPDDFGIPPENQFNHIITSPEDAVNISKGAIDFFEKHNFDKKRAMLAGLCVEELAVVLIEHGFNDKKQHYINIRLAIKRDSILIRFRDNCKPVNPIDFYKLDDPNDSAANIGVKMIIKMAAKVEYTKSLQLNNLLIVVL